MKTCNAWLALAATGVLMTRAVAADAPATPAADLEPAVATSSAATAKPAPAAGTAAAGKPATGRTERSDKPAEGAAASAKIELDATQITGNKELPKVMYVVPWKRSDLGEFGGRPAKSLLDEVLAPVDRDVFRRQTRYYDALKPDAAAQPAAGGGDEK